MTKVLRYLVILLAGALVMRPPSVASAPKSPVQFRSFKEFAEQRVGRVDLRLFGITEKPSPEAFPASFWANARCSATLVGEEVLLSAGHCFKNEPEVSIESDFIQYTGHCDTAQRVIPGANADFAVCVMDKPVKVSQFETVLSLIHI